MLVLQTESFLKELNKITEGLQNGERSRHKKIVEWLSEMNSIRHKKVNDVINFAWEDYYDCIGPDEEMQKAWDELEKNPAFAIVCRCYYSRLYEIQSALMDVLDVDKEEL